MSSKEFRRVYEEHKTVLDKHLASRPIKIGALARDLGVGDIVISSMPMTVSGQIAREDGQYVIRINRHESRERQRFTIAHELAHYLLHRSVIDSSPEGNQR